jgi:hypothetical protein
VVLLQFHLDVTECTDAFWWIDSPQAPTLYASGPTIVDARRRAMDRLDEAGLGAADVRYEIIDADNITSMIVA